MKNSTIVFLLLGAGAIYLISRKKKPKGKVIVPDYQKITAEQFEKPSLIQKAAPVLKNLAKSLKKKKDNSYKKKAAAAFFQKFGQKQVGNFPDMY